MKFKLNGTIIVIGLAALMLVIAYFVANKRKQIQPTLPVPEGVPMGKYPTWRILPYDPYKIGQPPVHNPYSPVHQYIVPKDVLGNLRYSPEHFYAGSTSSLGP